MRGDAGLTMIIRVLGNTLIVASASNRCATRILSEDTHAKQRFTGIVVEHPSAGLA